MLELNKTRITDFTNTDMTDKELAAALNCTMIQLRARKYNLVKYAERKLNTKHFNEILSYFIKGNSIQEVAVARGLSEKQIIDFLQANKDKFFINLNTNIYCTIEQAALLLQAMQDGLIKDRDITRTTKVHRTKLAIVKKIRALRLVTEYLITDIDLAARAALNQYLERYELINISNIRSFLYNKHLHIRDSVLPVILCLLIDDGATFIDGKILKKAPKEFRSIGELARAVVNG